MLSAALGPGARVGTVDKFQGQEAPVVVISLARSSFDALDDGLSSSGLGGGRSSEESSSGPGGRGAWADFGGDGSGREAEAAEDAEAARADLAAAAEGAADPRRSGEGGGSGGSSQALAFVLDVRRLNVALSRAQCLAVVVHSPALADSKATSLAQMRALSFVCRLVCGEGGA